jgi:hypothetical protein
MKSDVVVEQKPTIRIFLPKVRSIQWISMSVYLMIGVPINTTAKKGRNRDPVMAMMNTRAGKVDKDKSESEKENPFHLWRSQ